MAGDEVWGVVVSQELCAVGFWAGRMIGLIFTKITPLNRVGNALEQRVKQGRYQLGDLCFQSRWIMVVTWTKAVTEMGKFRFRIFFIFFLQIYLTWWWIRYGMLEQEQLYEWWYCLLRWKRLGKDWFGWGEIKNLVLDTLRILDIQKEICQAGSRPY